MIIFNSIQFDWCRVIIVIICLLFVLLFVVIFLMDGMLLFREVVVLEGLVDGDGDVDQGEVCFDLGLDYDGYRDVVDVFDVKDVDVISDGGFVKRWKLVMGWFGKLRRWFIRILSLNCW